MEPTSKAYLQGKADGSAQVLSWLRTLFTAAGAESFTRDEILITLDDVSQDGDLFPGCAAALALLDSIEVTE